MQCPLVSVVIPTYNCAPYIGQTIDSVLSQTYRPIEVIVVDDGSRDNTADIAESYGTLVRVIRQVNQRVCAARNRGFDVSQGAFVCFLDHDDLWLPWKIKRQIEAFAQHPDAGVVYTDFELWLPDREGSFQDPRSLDPGDEVPPEVDPDFSGWIYHQFLIDCWTLTSTAMIRREVFADSARFDPALPYSEDWDLWLRLSREHPFVKLARASTLYRQHPDQGNRVLRDVDHRTELLERAAMRWGLSSRDGRSVPREAFSRNLARYHMQFGLHHLQHGHRRVALAAFSRAFRSRPTYWRYPALMAATLLGWRPRAGN